MKRFIIVTAYSLAVIVLLLAVGYRGKSNTTSVIKTDYSALWSTEQPGNPSRPQPAAKRTETTFKDKSLAQGVDASPSVSFG